MGCMAIDFSLSSYFMYPKMSVKGHIVICHQPVFISGFVLEQL